jgi:hypothetical protein
MKAATWCLHSHYRDALNEIYRSVTMVSGPGAWAQMSRFHLKTETEFNIRNAVL